MNTDQLRSRAATLIPALPSAEAGIWWEAEDTISTNFREHPWLEMNAGEQIFDMGKVTVYQTDQDSDPSNDLMIQESGTDGLITLNAGAFTVKKTESK